MKASNEFLAAFAAACFYYPLSRRKRHGRSSCRGRVRPVLRQTCSLTGGPNDIEACASYIVDHRDHGLPV